MELVAASLPQDFTSSWDVQNWKALTNDPSFLGGIESWDRGTDALVERARGELARTEAHRGDAVEGESGHSIRATRTRLESAQSLKDAWQLLRQAAADWPARLSWQEWASFLEQRLEMIVGTSGDWLFFSTVLDELGNLQALNGSEIRDPGFEEAHDVSREGLKTALVESLSSLSYPAGRFQRSGVNLLSTSAARGLRFPLALIPGLDEGCFPAKVRQDPLLLDSERLRMGTLPIKSKRMDEEKLLFDMAARSAERRLVVMTSRLEESSDREKIPSQFFMRVAAAARGAVVSMRDLSEGTIPGFRSVSLDNPAPAEGEIPVDEGEIRLRLVISERESGRAALEALAEMEPLRLKRSLAYDRARWMNKLTGFDGLISDPLLIQWTAKEIGPSAGQVSASRIEEYAKCPYLFFLKRVVGLEAWEEQGKMEGLVPLDRGLAIHSILEDFLKNLSGEVPRAASREKLLHLLESQACEGLERSRPPGTPDLLWEIERDALIAMLKNWLAFELDRGDEGMDIRLLEQAFGEFGLRAEHPALRLRAGSHTFDFRGRIDRIDVSRDGKRARVIDYKTGTLPESMARKTRTPLMSGERIQIVIYRGALSVIGGFKGLEEVEGEYLYLQPRDGHVVPCSFTDEELQEASAALPDILEILGNGIEEGVFFARTRGMIRPYGHCDFCDYLPICGKDRMQREERKRGDPAVQRFLRIVEPLQ
jgi:ATP-dependent helicase/nuclease subunit B